jgi:hypothetical protein
MPTRIGKTGRYRTPLALTIAIVLLLPRTAVADDVPLDQVPAAVRATIEREVGDGRIKEIDRDRRDGRRVYEVEFTRDDKDHEVLIAEDGTVLEREED